MTYEIMKHYADMILTPEPVIVKKTKSLTDHLTTMAESIYNCPKRNYTHRRYDQVYSHTLGKIIDIALAAKADLELNPKEFDVTDRDSYCYDVYDPNNNIKFECKQWAVNYYSFHPSSIKTFLNNLDVLDYLVCGKMSEEDEHFSVNFYMIANAKTFNKYAVYSLNEESRARGMKYYAHKRAVQDGEAIVASRFVQRG